MNVSTFGLVAFVFVTLLAMGMAGLYYLRHWARRHARLADCLVSEGVFFKRFLPLTLRARYDGQRQRQAKDAAQHLRMLQIRMVAIFAGGVLVVGAWVAMANWHRWMWVDLSDAEIGSLDYREHRWTREVDNRLPRLASLLPLLRTRGVVLVSAESDTRLQLNGRPIAAVAAAQWQRFLMTHQVPFRRCLWHTVLEGCDGADVYIVLPGHWDLSVADRLLARGKDLLFYGPPDGPVSRNETVEFQGLRFAPRYVASRSHLAVVGDQLLTLGFDAGLVVGAVPSFPGFAAQSQEPQALAIDDSHEIGGELDTRWYARTRGNGRWVWMDFSPNPSDYADTPDPRHLEAVVAASFRYLLRLEYGAWATWPDGQRFAGMLSVDAEDQFERAHAVAALARRLGIRISWFILSNEAQRHRGLTRELTAVGEIACHGDSHAIFSGGDRASQIIRIARCAKVLKALTGITPQSFRPPEERHDDATVDAVANNGMSYFFAVNNSDRAVPVRVRAPDTSMMLVSLPRIGSDDYELWHTRKLGFRDSINRAEHELQWAASLGGFLAFDFHTQFVDDEHLKVVEHYAQRMQGDDAFLATAGEIADWWRVRTHLERGEPVKPAMLERYRPVRLVVHRDGVLMRSRAKPSRSAADRRDLASTSAAGEPVDAKTGRGAADDGVER